MKRSQITIGIDIGTHYIKVIVSEKEHGQSRPKIIGYGFSKSKGIRHGYVIHPTDAVTSIRKAIRNAEKESGIQISEAFISIGGIGLGSFVSTGNVIVSRADSEITDIDVDKAMNESQEDIPSSHSANRRVLHAIPVGYKIDGKDTLGKPQGLKGSRLEVKTLFITCLEHHLNELFQVIEDAGVEIIDVMASPLASSFVTLTKSQKIAGCVLANIGSETVSIMVFENGIPISLEVFPIGSNDITNDLALGLQVSLEEAEEIKIFEENRSSHPKKKLEDIISARLSDIFELIEAHLKKNNKSGLLPAGVIITGGGAGISMIDDIAKAYLKLPSRAGGLLCDPADLKCLPNTVDMENSSWSVAFGLCIFGLTSDKEGYVSSGSIKRMFKQMKNKLVKFFTQFLP